MNLTYRRAGVHSKFWTNVESGGGENSGHDSRFESRLVTIVCPLHEISRFVQEVQCKAIVITKRSAKEVVPIFFRLTFRLDCSRTCSCGRKRERKGLSLVLIKRYRYSTISSKNEAGAPE